MMIRVLVWFALYIVASSSANTSETTTTDTEEHPHTIPTPDANALLHDETPPVTTTTSSSSTTSTCSLLLREDEIRHHCDRLLSEKDQRCAESKRESAAHCDGLLQASQDAATQAHAAHQQEMQKLTSVITQIRGQKDTIHADCERRVSESYSKGWHEAETLYQEQLHASQAATEQSRTAHQTEVQRLASIINQIREQTDSTHNVCEQRVTESYLLGKREAEGAIQKQLEQVQRQLVSNKITVQLRNEYLTAENARLERDNRQLQQASSRTLQLLLDTQRDLARVTEQLASKSVARRAGEWVLDSVVLVWDSMLAAQAHKLWNKLGQRPWQHYGIPLWNNLQRLHKQVVIHGPLTVGLLSDVSITLITETALIIQDLPEIIPREIEKGWNASEPIREYTAQQFQTFLQSTKTIANNVTRSVSIKTGAIWQRMYNELHLEEMEPHVRAIRQQKEKMDQSLAPHVERAGRIWENFKRDSLNRWKSIRKDMGESAQRLYTHLVAFLDRGRQVLGTWKDNFVQEFSLTARTVYLFLRVYHAPQPLLDAVEYCHREPDHVLELLLWGLGAGMLVKRLLFPVKKRKRQHQRKVQFVLSQ